MKKLNLPSDEVVRYRKLALLLFIVIGLLITLLYINLQNTEFITPHVEAKEIVRVEYVDKPVIYKPETIEQKIRWVFGEDGEDAIRVAKAESGLRSVCNDGLNRNGSVDCGIFMINSIHGIPRQYLLNEDINIMVAKQMFDRQGWQPWYSSRSKHGL